MLIRSVLLVQSRLEKMTEETELVGRTCQGLVWLVIVLEFTDKVSGCGKVLRRGKFTGGLGLWSCWLERELGRLGSTPVEVLEFLSLSLPS